MRKKDPIDEKTFKMSKVKYPKEKKKRRSGFKFILFLIVLFFIINGFLAALEYNNIYTIIAETVLKDKLYSIDNISEEDIVYEEIPELNQEEMEKLLSEYILLNYYNDMKIGSKDITLSENEVGNIVRLEIASSLIYTKEQTGNTYLKFSDVDFQDSKVNKAIQEFIGERVAVVVGTTNNKSFTYDSDNKKYVQTGEATIYPAKIKEIEKVEYYKDGNYFLITFKYFYPNGEDVASNDAASKYDEYEATMKLGINEDYTYAKYRIYDYKNIKSALVKKNEKVVKTEEIKPQIENTVSPVEKVPENKTANTVQTQDATEQIKKEEFLIGVWRPLKGYKIENNSTNDEELSAIFGPSEDGNYGEINFKMDGSFVENLGVNKTLTNGRYKVGGNNIMLTYPTLNEKVNIKYDPETKQIKMMITDNFGVILSK